MLDEKEIAAAQGQMTPGGEELVQRTAPPENEQTNAELQKGSIVETAKDVATGVSKAIDLHARIEALEAKFEVWEKRMSQHGIQLFTD